MDELVKLVAKKTGLTEKKAKVAVELVLDYLKEKLPPPLAGQADAVLKGGGLDLSKGLEGLLGQ